MHDIIIVGTRKDAVEGGKEALKKLSDLLREGLTSCPAVRSALHHEDVSQRNTHLHLSSCAHAPLPQLLHFSKCPLPPCPFLHFALHTGGFATTSTTT